MMMNHDRSQDPFDGVCPFHGDCLEGMASGPSMTKRWAISTHDMPPDHPAWELEARYLGQAVHNLCLFYSPQRVIMGGGVMKAPGLLPKIRTNVRNRSTVIWIHPSSKRKTINSLFCPNWGIVPVRWVPSPLHHSQHHPDSARRTHHAQ
jgi:fructokinase